MNIIERQQVIDLCDLQINRYFDHYLTTVFPHQIEAMFAAHNQDAEAHDPRFEIHLDACPTKKRMDKWKWMMLGGSAVAGVVGTLLVEHLGAVIRALG